MADKTINELTAATTMGNDDLLVLQQGGTAKKLSGKKLGDYVYNAAAEKVAEVNKAVDDARSSINDIVESVQSMTELGTDTALTVSGMAADAKAAGDKIKAIETAALADLSQGTASGSIVTITDGADDIPVKKMTVGIEPVQDLHGYDHPWPAGGGKNLLQVTATTTTLNGITYTINRDGSVNVNGTSTLTHSFVLTTLNKAFDADVIVTGAPTGAGSSTCTIQINGSDLVTAGGSVTIAAGTTITDIRLRCANGAIISNMLFKPMICLATETDATFAPYENICPITGFTGAKVKRTGINIWDEEWENGYFYVSDGRLIYGANTSTVRSKNFIPVKPNTSYYGLNTASDSIHRYIYRIACYDNEKNFISVSSRTTFTTPNNCYYIKFYVEGLGTYTSGISINYPSTDTEYHPYAGTIYDITFPSEAGTVYGGSLEVNEDGSGTLTVNRFSKTYTNAITTWAQGYEDIFMLSRDAVNPVDPAAKTITTSIADVRQAKVISNLYAKNAAQRGNVGVTSMDDKSIYVYDKMAILRDSSYIGDISSLNEALTQSPLTIVYEIATPKIYPLTAGQVTTLLGTNNVWSDTGDISEFVYRKAPVDSSNIDAKITEIESIISGRETAMTATKNYSFGDLVIVDSVLYKLDTNMASGETLIPDTNCHVTTIEAEIAECVPNYRFVNGKTLYSDVILSAEDIPYNDSLSEHMSGSVGEVVSGLKESIKDTEELIGNLGEQYSQNDFIRGRYLSDGFNSNSNYARNRNPYPAGEYYTQGFTVVSHAVYAYVSDTQGDGIFPSWSAAAQHIISDKPFYISFTLGSTGQAEKLAAINESFVIVKVADKDESTITGRIPATPEMYGAKGDGVFDDADALIKMFTSGYGNYLLKNTYAISKPVDVNGHIYGGGKILVKDSARIKNLFTVSNDTTIDNIVFDCNSNIAYAESDDSVLNVAIKSESNNYNLVVKNCSFINGYTMFIHMHLLTGKIDIYNNLFVADGVNNPYVGYMIYMLTINGSEHLHIKNNRFIGNGNAESNFAGIFMAGITSRTDFVIENNFFNGIGRNKTGGHQSFCVDAYWNVSNLIVRNNTMINNAYCCIRVHGSTNFAILNNYLGNANAYTADASVLISDDYSSTGATNIGVTKGEIVGNILTTTALYYTAIQLTSDNSQNNGRIVDVDIKNNIINGNYRQAILLDGSVSNLKIADNKIEISTNGIIFSNTSVPFVSTNPIYIERNSIKTLGGTCIYALENAGDINVLILNNDIFPYTNAILFVTKTDYSKVFNNVISGNKGISNIYSVVGNVLDITDDTVAVVNASVNAGNYVNGALVT